MRVYNYTSNVMISSLGRYIAIIGSNKETLRKNFKEFKGIHFGKRISLFRNSANLDEEEIISLQKKQLLKGLEEHRYKIDSSKSFKEDK